MFCTYILESPGGDWYYGHCSEIARRLYQHNTGQNKSTRNKGPWRVIFLKYFDTNLEANRFELYLKKLRNKKFIYEKYKDYFLDA